MAEDRISKRTCMCSRFMRNISRRSSLLDRYSDPDSAVGGGRDDARNVDGTDLAVGSGRDDASLKLYFYAQLIISSSSSKISVFLTDFGSVIIVGKICNGSRQLQTTSVASTIELQSNAQSSGV